VSRARRVRTTIADPAATRAPDLVKRCFAADRPDELHVRDRRVLRPDRRVGVRGLQAHRVRGTGDPPRPRPTAVGRAARWTGRRSTTPTPARSTPRSGSARPSRSRDSSHRSGRSGTPSTTPSRKRPSGCTGPSASETDPRSVPGRSVASPISNRSPRPGCTGTTPAGSCTDWADVHPSKPKPTTTLTMVTADRSFTRNEGCTKPGQRRGRQHDEGAGRGCAPSSPCCPDVRRQRSRSQRWPPPSG
jgi:hypothetical protein